MPKQYEAIRDKFLKEGMSEDEAKRRAAKIYNADHPKSPVTPATRKREESRGRRS